MNHSLRPDFLRPLPVVSKTPTAIGLARSPSLQNASDEPLSLMAREVARELEADGILVALHDSTDESVCVFFENRGGEDLETERYLLDTASTAACSREQAGGAHWSKTEDSSTELLTTSLAVDGAVVTVTTLFRRVSISTRMRARESAMRLLPMLQPFFRLWASRREALVRESGMTAALKNCDVSILIVNRRCELLFANDAADAMMAQGDGLRRNGRTIGCARFADTLRLHDSIEHVAGDGINSNEMPVIALSRKDRRSIMAAVVACENPSQDAADGAVVIYAFDPEQDLHDLIRPACKLYGLSPVEARLTCLLANGASLAEAAQQMRVRELTARSYLKQIFLKTDTNRQAELVCLMLKSSVRTSSKLQPTFM